MKCALTTAKNRYNIEDRRFIGSIKKGSFIDSKK
jgi:hypothetical protein